MASDIRHCWNKKCVSDKLEQQSSENSLNVPRLEVKLSQMTGLVWNSCNTIYKYVIIMHHIILSNRTVSEEKELLANTVRDLTALI